MFFRLAAAAILAGTTMVAIADQPNINPGMWEYTTTMSFQSDFPIPDQSDTRTECVTAEDIAEGDTFIEEMEGCDLTRRDLTRDRLDYVMECRAPDGTTMRMEANVEFNGDSSTGHVTGDMETPMGPMKMDIRMLGRRTGDC
jgi:hypothetical protein